MLALQAKALAPSINRDSYHPHRAGQKYIYRFASNRLSEDEAKKASGEWTSYCFCHRPLIPTKRETAYGGNQWELFEWTSVCYACGMPPELCNCPPSRKKDFGQIVEKFNLSWEEDVQVQTFLEDFNNGWGESETSPH